VVLAGAALIALAGWPLWGVFGALMAGTVCGAWMSWRVGVWLSHTERETWLHRRLERPGTREQVARLCERFARHGALYLVLNRFLPAFRSLFFVTAGMAGMGRGPVLLAALVGGGLWNGLLLGVGWAVGYKLDVLEGLLRGWGQLMWAILAVIAAVWAVRRLQVWGRRS
jgi:membrane protein DedA with SNARE-associated domain